MNQPQVISGYGEIPGRWFLEGGRYRGLGSPRDSESPRGTVDVKRPGRPDHTGPEAIRAELSSGPAEGRHHRPVGHPPHRRRPDQSPRSGPGRAWPPGSERGIRRRSAGPTRDRPGGRPRPRRAFVVGCEQGCQGQSPTQSSRWRASTPATSRPVWRQGGPYSGEASSASSSDPSSSTPSRAGRSMSVQRRRSSARHPAGRTIRGPTLDRRAARHAVSPATRSGSSRSTASSPSSPCRARSGVRLAFGPAVAVVGGVAVGVRVIRWGG